MRIAIYLTGVLLTFGLLIAGCVTTSDYNRQEDRISSLQAEIRDLKEQLQVKQMEMERQVSQTRSNIPEVRQEVDRMRSELQRLASTIETSDGKTALSSSDKMTLREQLNFIQVRLDRMEAKMHLPPLSPQVLEPPATPDIPDENPRIEVKPGQAAPDQNLLETARQLYEKKSYQEALSKFRTVLAQKPKAEVAASAQFYIGECLYQMKQYEEAILEYQKVVKDYPKSPRVSIALLKQAYAFLSIGDKTSGKLLMQKVIKEYPDSYAAGVAKQKLPTI